MPRTRKRTKGPISPILPYLPFAAVAVIIAVVLANTQTANRSNTNSNTNSAIEIRTDDNITLSADMTWPDGKAPVPVVILIHDFITDRHQWDPYVTKFTASGFAVLQYDMRGFGHSRLPQIDADRTAYLNSLPQDLPALITYLHHQPRAANQSIHVVGVGLGANVAYVARGSGYGLARTVIISPGAGDGVLDGTAIPSFAPSTIFGLDDAEGQAGLMRLMDRVAEPKKITVTTGNGITVLDDPAVMADVITWLKS